MTATLTQALSLAQTTDSAWSTAYAEVRNTPSKTELLGPTYDYEPQARHMAAAHDETNPGWAKQYPLLRIAKVFTIEIQQ